MQTRSTSNGLGGLLRALGPKRTDGDFIEGLHPYRRIMAHIMKGRNESVVYFDSVARCEKLLAYIEEAKARDLHCDITHCLVGACAIGLSEVPQMNRFVVGRRLYQRNGVWITFSMKRRKMDREAKLSVVKRQVHPGETFRDLLDRMNTDIQVERSSKKTYMDKELSLLDALPRSVLDLGVGVLRGLDHYNLLPDSFIKNDGMYTSIFIANLGSLGMGAGYHHLYEWGTCPLFMMVGQIEERPMVVDGKIKPTKVLPIRWSYDERIDDGLNARFGIDSVVHVLETPYESLGCLAADGSDARPLLRDPIR